MNANIVRTDNRPIRPTQRNSPFVQRPQDNEKKMISVFLCSVYPFRSNTSIAPLSATNGIWFGRRGFRSMSFFFVSALRWYAL